jgi:predicted transcriptional regulator
MRNPEREAFKAELHMLRRTGRLAPSAVAVGEALADLPDSERAPFPSITTLIRLTGCRSTATVSRALRQLQQAGLLNPSDQPGVRFRIVLPNHATEPPAVSDRDWDEWVTGLAVEGRLTAAQERVMLALPRFRRRGGSVHTSHPALAARAGCSVRSVQRALQAAREMGLVKRTARYVRGASEVYELIIPGRPSGGRP